MQLSIDSKVQFFAYQKLRDTVAEHKAKAGSVVVLDARRARCWPGQLPQLRPRQRQQPDGRAAAQPRHHRHLRARLDHEAHHHWAWRWNSGRAPRP